MSQLTSNITFDPATGVVVPESQDIREVVGGDWVAAFNKGEGYPQLNIDETAPAGQLVDAETAEIEAKNAELLFLSNMFNPRLSEGRWQDALSYIYFLTRKIAEATVVQCTVTGIPGTIVPYGALVKTGDGHTLLCTDPIVIGADKSGTGYFRVTDTGPIEIAANTVTQIVTVVAGWDTVNNPAPGSIGRYIESRAEMEARRYGSVAKNAHGSAVSIYGTIANLPGVLDCAVLENVGPDPITKFGVNIDGHSIAACVYGGSDDDIAEAIYTKKDVGCGTSGNHPITWVAYDFSGAIYHYSIYRPTAINFYVKVALGNYDDLAPEILTAVKQAVVDDFNGLLNNPRVGLASTIYASRFYGAVTDLDDAIKLDNITIALNTPSGWVNHIQVNADQEPVISTANVSIEGVK